MAVYFFGTSNNTCNNNRNSSSNARVCHEGSDSLSDEHPRRNDLRGPLRVNMKLHYIINHKHVVCPESKVISVFKALSHTKLTSETG